jgi:predicted RND superfamily exporter protein
LIWKGNMEIQKEYSQSVMQSRIMSAFCIFVIFIMCIVHYFDIISDVALYVIVLCVYITGATFVAIRKYDILNWTMRNKSYNKLKKAQKLSEED